MSKNAIKYQNFILGVGTGADLDLIPHQELNITAIDYSEEMLNQAKRKFGSSSIVFRQMALSFESIYQKYRDERIILEDEGLFLQGMYRKIKLKKAL